MFEELRNRAHAWRNRRVHRKFFESSRREFHAKLYRAGDKIRLLSGPFAGMRYLNTSSFGPIAPKWLGSYEWEIQDLVRGFCTSGYDLVVNVGSAEGYYAVGFAWRSCRSRVLAFDIDPFARREVARLAHMNGVGERVTIATTCSRSVLEALRHGSTLLFVDIEGAEREFLDPSNCSAIKKFDILVELHQLPEVEELIKNRFRSTHAIERRAQTNRMEWQDKHKELWSDRFNEDEIARATNEFRTRQQAWLWLKAREGNF
jgi:hypothetical protein